MGIAQSRGIPVLPGKPGEIPHHCQQLAPEIPQALPVEDKIRVVSDIAGGGSQMDDACGGGGRLAVGVDVGHHVVADLFFPLGGAVIVDVGDMGFQLRNLLRRDGEAQIVFRPGQGHPQPPPSLNPCVGGEEPQHEGGGIPGGKGGFVTIFCHENQPFFF